MKKESVIEVRQLTIVAVLGAISVVLGMTPLGFIPIGGIKATTMHIPVIIGGIVEGPLVGALVGLLFGISSVVDAITKPGPFSIMFYNPIVAILPRVLIGIVSAYAYDLLKNKLRLDGNISIIISSILASLTNTVGVLSSIYIFYGQRYVEALGFSPDKAGRIIFGIGLTNGIPEAILASIICLSVVRGLRYEIRR